MRIGRSSPGSKCLASLSRPILNAKMGDEANFDLSLPAPVFRFMVFHRPSRPVQFFLGLLQSFKRGRELFLGKTACGRHRLIELLLSVFFLMREVLQFLAHRVSFRLCSSISWLGASPGIPLRNFCECHSAYDRSYCPANDAKTASIFFASRELSSTHSPRLTKILP